MARIAGINIPNHQHAEIALTAIYGIGRARAQAICAAAGVPGNRKIKDLNDGELEVSVTDRGAWREADETPARGRGRTIMETLMREVTVASAPDGTTVRMRLPVAGEVPV